MPSEIDVKHYAAIAAGRYDHTGPAYFLPAVRDVLEALTAAGRLLPDGGETREEWTATMRANSTDLLRQPPRATRLFGSSSAAAEWALGFADGGQLRLWRRDCREWTDGARLTGPWVEVTDAAG